MTNKEAIEQLTTKLNIYYFTDKDNEALDLAIKALEDLAKIKEITERALRSQDPINLYKACCINEIAELLGIEEVKQDIKEQDDKDQITIDDIIKEV